MKLTKKLCVILSAAMICCQLPANAINVSAISGDTFTIEGISYEVLDDNLTAKVTSVADKKVTSFSVPDTVTNDGSEYKVAVVDSELFKGSTTLTTVQFGANVTEICNGAFRGCTSLTNVTLPTSLTKLGYDAFADDTALTTIQIPAALSETSGLYGARSPFRGCSNLTNITFAAGATMVASGLFGECTWLKSITLPDTITTIGDDAFNGCSALTEINFPETLTDIGVKAFAGCNRITSVNLPEGLVNIGYNAFKACQSLTSVYIPTTLNEVTGLFDTYSPFEECASLNDIKFGEGITTIAGALFSGCNYIKSISIPATVRKIGDYAFNGCTALESISLPDDVSEIGPKAFNGCTRITEVTLPKYLDKLGYDAFGECKSLKAVKIQSNISEISGLFESYGPFESDAALTDISFSEDVTSLPNYVFSNCTSIMSLVIPETVIYMGESAIKNCSSSLVIYGVAGSTAETYATANNITFKDISGAPIVATPSVGTIASTRTETILSGTEAYVKETGDASFSLGVTTNNTDSQSLTYTTDNATVANVDANGYVVIGATGTANITVKGAITDNFTPATKVITVTVVEMSKVPAVGKTYTLNGIKYTVTKSAKSGGAVKVSGISKKTAKSASIAANVKLNGYIFNVTSIGANAFKGCKKLKTITINSTKIKSMGSNAFKNVPKSAKAKVPSSKKASYKKMMKKAGYKGKIL